MFRTVKNQLRVKKDIIKDGISTNESDKIPRKTREQSGNHPGLTGNIIFDPSQLIFYGYTGSTWVPFHGNYAPVNAAFITTTLSDNLTNERFLTAGNNITIVDGGANGPITINGSSITLSNSGTPAYSIVNDGSGPTLAVKAINPGTGIVIENGSTNITIGLGGAPPVVDAQFVTMALNAGLSQERVLTAGTNISIVDGGAKGPVTINTPSITLSNAGAGYSLVNNSSGPNLATKSITAGTGLLLQNGGSNITIGLSISSTPAPFNASFVTVNSESELTNERVLTAGINISIIDGGANGPITVDTTYKRTVVTLSPYSVLQSDDIIAVYPTSATIQINLPQISSLTTPNKYKRYSIVDEGGNAGNNPIYVTSYTGNTIIGDTTVVVNQNYNAISVYTDGNSNWFIN